MYLTTRDELWAGATIEKKTPIEKSAEFHRLEKFMRAPRGYRTAGYQIVRSTKESVGWNTTEKASVIKDRTQYLTTQLERRILHWDTMDERKKHAVMFLRALELMIMVAKIFQMLHKQNVSVEKTRPEFSRVIQEIQQRYQERTILASRAAPARNNASLFITRDF